MTQLSLTFDAVNEETPGPKWAARWNRSWPAYEAWFIARGGDQGPSRDQCREALKRYMPELVATYDRLVIVAGGSDRAARFLSTWCPPTYLGGCSLAAVASKKDVRLVRNYDLSPQLNEGLLLRTKWSGRTVMGMVEFLWGLSDGINDAGLSIALAYGGRSESGEGFGVTTILRYVLETCGTVDEALVALKRVPSHMAYNLVLADASGRTASVELAPGGGMTQMPIAVATNHQSGKTVAERPAFTRTFQRRAHLEKLRVKPRKLNRQFLKSPLLQDRHAQGFGTLFTAEYNPKKLTLGLTLNGQRWDHGLNDFAEGQRIVDYSQRSVAEDAHSRTEAGPGLVDWSQAALVDWNAVAHDYAAGNGRAISTYFPSGRLNTQKVA
ncbi:C45 family autoproteolytic acyltransferase/hydolase [Sulfitobacter guttiformis]|uniref:Putative choloylglycine hydrolase n=1 Tax=Sulfitobacter guttiformis TaxID=74349 RepID=A0A420DPH5_9RHOB|nr:C45 family peptidase [Sulfitobacter guttiformis]KIN73470.1 Acyl-coenzyme A:6-aminopenicillanic acid acyl-transferase subfamily [Sulfitobacter guttiformis KCTC 32187]RKE96132.1 putative choloylglycine hydrolase [Sulfitobacter guttiformis]